MLNFDNREENEVRLRFRCPLNVVLRYFSDRLAFDATLTNALRKAMMTMLTHTASEKGRAAVPLITNATGISPFPFRIAGIVNGVELP